MSVFSDMTIKHHEEGTMERSEIKWKLEQLTEDYAAAVAPTSFNPTMREVYVSPEHLTAALLLPVSYGAVIADVCETLGVAIPWSVRVAIGDDPTPAAA